MNDRLKDGLAQLYGPLGQAHDRLREKMIAALPEAVPELRPNYWRRKQPRITWLRPLISTTRRKVAFACCVVLLSVAATWGANKLYNTICQTIEDFRSAAVAGRDSEAASLTDPRSAVARQLDDWRGIEEMNPEGFRVASVYASDTAALAITTEVGADHDRRGPLVITLLKQEGRWVIRDIDVETAATARDELDRFLKKYPDAVEVPATQSPATD